MLTCPYAHALITPNNITKYTFYESSVDSQYKTDSGINNTEIG